MSADIKRAWLAEVLGVEFDVAESTQKGGAQRQKIGLDTLGEALQSATEFVSKLFSAPEVTEVQKQLRGEVDTLEKLGLGTDRLKFDWADQEQALVDAAKLTDASERDAAVKRARKRLEQLRDHAQALAKATKKVMGDAKGTPDDAQKSTIYQKALKERYGLKIEVPKGMSNTHFDRVFDMMGAVPRDQTKHRKLKKLSYTDDKNWKGSGAYGGAEILMGDFGNAKGTENYEVDGKKVPANSFDVTTLHEMGHALDDAKKIMDKHGAKSGCGGWKRESVATIADAMLAHFKKANNVGKALTDDMVQEAIREELEGTVPAMPNGVAPSDWKLVIDYLKLVTARSRGSYSPWFENTAVNVGGRAYVESYDNEWWSYEHASRAPTRVNNYQWRSPAEWFAEVYAITWLKKVKPPAAVDASVAAFMWQG